MSCGSISTNTPARAGQLQRQRRAQSPTLCPSSVAAISAEAWTARQEGQRARS